MANISVITGDIINSRKDEKSSWIEPLSQYFLGIGSRRTTWDIYRGDSFQIVITDDNPIKVAFTIKSIVKQNKQLDVRLAIGLGEISYRSENITESNGSAFQNSGQMLDSLDKNTVGIKTPYQEFDKYFNVILNLSEKITESWKPITAMIVYKALMNQGISQKELSKKLQKSESSVSRALSRGGYSEIRKVIDLYKETIVKL